MSHAAGTRGTNGTGSSSLWQLVKERRTRDAIYGAPSYWDARASARRGMARSLWPSNAFNALWDDRQRTIIVRALGSLSGRRVVDIGCGTGRIARWLAEQRGAGHVVGVDFSPATVDAARAESAGLVASGLVRFEPGDVVAGLTGLAGKDGLAAGSFDDAIVLGCLSVACSDRDALAKAFANLATLVRKGGRVLVLEPIHRSPLLRRVLDLGIEDWVACANAAGLSLSAADRMGFVPVRLVLSVRDLPSWASWVVGPVFRAGESVLDTWPWLSPLADYKLLLFTRD